MTTTTDDHNHDNHQPGNSAASTAQGFLAPGKGTWLLPIVIAHTLPPSPPRVVTGRCYTILDHAAVLDEAQVLVQGSWEPREYLDITTRNAKLNWLAKAITLSKIR